MGYYSLIYLSYICLASKWPERVQLKATTAEAVAKAMMELICTTGIPLTILTDQGFQFLGRLESLANFFLLKS